MRLRFFSILLAAITLFAFVPATQAGCIRRHKVAVASGNAPSGWHWTVDGTIGNNGRNCREWLFGMDFTIEGAIDWGWGTGIPAGGHLSSGFDIEASDDLLEDGSYRVFSGTVNGEVAKVVITLSDNEHLTIYPKSPTEQLRRKVVWLRNVRYFVDYYPPKGFVTGVATFSASGQLLYRDKTFEEF